MAGIFGGEIWSSGAIHLLIGLVAAGAVLAWNPKITLPALVVVQWAVGNIMVSTYGLPARWPGIYLWTIVLCSLILGGTALQMGRKPEVDRSSNLLFRTLLLGLVGMLLRWGNADLPLPLLEGATSSLFLWLGICALLTLALSDSPLYTAVGLLLWSIPIQSLLAVIVPQPALIALLGTLSLLIALSCSYLMLAESTALMARASPLTDIAFPPMDLPRFRPLGAGAIALWSQIQARLSLLGEHLKRSSR